MNTQIKICGVSNPEMAIAIAMKGVNYIGIIFHEKSKRRVDITLGKAIADSTKRGGAIPVAVFGEHSGLKMQEICDATGIKVAQLHGNLSRAEHHMLSNGIQKIFVVHVDKMGNITNIDDSIQSIDTERDAILFDNIDKNSELIVITPSIINIAKKFKTFIAGGINKNNISNILEQCQPYAIDLCSGVESSEGEKSLELVKEILSETSRYGRYGGTYMPESLMAAITKLASAFHQIKNDPQFRDEFDNLLKQYAGRPTPLTEVVQFQQLCKGPRLFLKREDLLHTGAHKINNALGQCLVAKKMGKVRIIAETGAGQHGVATATACARLNLDCVIYMGAVDIVRQAPNVDKMRLLGAKVIAVEEGSKTLKDAVNAALRDYASSFHNTHYCLGSALGPHPYPEMVAYFQSVIGQETHEQCQKMFGKLPDLVIACVGGGSNAIGIFSAFLDQEVRLVAVEAGGTGLQHAARFQGGSPGILHGCMSYLLQDKNGQVLNTHSISAGLDYPLIGPQHAHLYETNRVEYTSCTDDEALHAFKALSQSEGIIPALESAHALAYYLREAPTLDPNSIVIINLSGRGDKDLAQLTAGGLL
jgi:phosphoribosylanthranilate isomerase